MSSVNNGNPLGVMGSALASIDEEDTAADGDLLADEPSAAEADGCTIPAPADRYENASTVEGLNAAESPAQELDRLARAAETEPASAACALRYIQALLARGMHADGMHQWRAATARVDAQGAYSLHEGVARAFLDNGAHSEAREVLEAIQPQGLSNNIELNQLWSELQHMEEAERLGGCVFPLSVPFDECWIGPHLRKDLIGNPALLAWHPGKIEDIGEQEVVILYGVRDKDETKLYNCLMDRAVFENSGISVPEGIANGQFLEIYVLEDGDGKKTELALYERPVGWKIPESQLRLLEIDLDPNRPHGSDDLHEEK